MRTKAEEIALLRQTAAELGKDSYCGPWLESVLAAVERDMRADIPPLPCVDATRRECERMISEARVAAADVWLEADKAKQAARADRVRVREAFKNSIRLACKSAHEALEKL